MGDHDKQTLEDYGFTVDELEGPKIDRRTTIRLFGMASMGAFAGCLGGDDDGNGNGNGTGNGNGNGNGTGNGNGNGNGTGNGNGNGNGNGTGEINTGGSLRAGWHIGEIESLDPALVTNFRNIALLRNISNGPVRVNDNGEIAPALATDWEVQEDPFSITFDLREGVKFHNGDEVTAEDLKFTTRRTIEVEGSIVASNYDTLLPVDEGGVEVIDDYTIQYTYEVPFAPAIASFTTVGGRSCNPVNQDALDEMGTDQFGLTPVLTGPFEVTEHVFGDFVRLEAFDDYWETDENGNQLPYLDEVEIQMIPEPATGINALRAGDIDFLDRPPADLVVDLEGEDDVVVNEAPGLRREGLNMNFFRDELNDPWNTQKRREALARLVDNEAYHEQVNNGRGTTTTHAISPAAEFWHQGDDIPDTQNYDPERAMEIIEEEGMKDVSFSIMAPARSERKARVLRNMFMEAGLEVEVNQVTDSGFVDAVINSTFESTILGSGAEIDPDPMFYRSFRASYLYKEEDPLDIGEENYDGVWNRAGYLNERVHELLGEQRTETDQEPRREMIHEVENILIEDVAQIFLGFDNDLTGYRDHMKGYGPVIIQQRYLGEVWLDE